MNNMLASGKTKFLVILVIVLILIAIVFNYAKDQIISYQLSKDFKMPIKVRGVNFNLGKAFKKQSEKITLKLLAVGEGDATINLENIEITNIRKNSNQPNYCLDGHALAEKIYLGHKATPGCSGALDFACVPYIPDKQKNPHILISNALVKLGNSNLRASGVVDTDMKTEISTVQVHGALSRGALNKTLACLNADTDQITAEAEVPNFEISFDAAEKIDPSTNIRGHGNFNLYQGEFKFINLIEPIIEHLKSSPDASKTTQGDNFDKLSSNFAIRDQKLYLSNLALSNRLFSATGQGSIGFNNQMDMSILVYGVDKILPTKFGQVLPGGTVPLKITGPTEKPQIRPDMAGVVGQMAGEAVNQAINKAGEALQKLWQ